MKNILVTGGAGYIGSHTVVELVANGFEPIILDNFSNASTSVIERMNELCGKDLTVITGDCSDADLVATIFKTHSIQGVIHFAAHKAVGESVDNPLMYYNNNLNGLITVLKTMEQFGVRQFVFSSSCTVYGVPKNGTQVSEETPLETPNSPYGWTKYMGEQIIKDVAKTGSIDAVLLRYFNPIGAHKSGIIGELPQGVPKNGTQVSEETPLETPNSPYGWTKYMGEQIIKDVAKTGSIDAVLLRYFNPIGAHKSGIIGELPQGVPNNIVPYITQTAAGIREQLTVFGSDYPTEDGTCIRDYIHVCDLALAHIKALAVVQTNEPAIFNVGTGKGTSVIELIAAFEKATGNKINWQFGPRRAGDVTAIFARADKAKNELNWEANFSVEEAVSDAWKWEKFRVAKGLE